jgi:hypothetical protein
MKIKLATMAALASLLLTQCKKEDVTPILDEKAAFLEKAQQFVKTAAPAADVAQLDWGRAIAYKKDGTYQMVRVPLRGNTLPGQKAMYLRYHKGRLSGNYFELSNNTVTTLSLDNVRKCVAPVTGNGQMRDYTVYENGQQVQDVTGMADGIMRPRPPMYFYSNASLHYLITMLGLGQGGIGGDVNYTPQSVASYLEAPLDGSEMGGGGSGEIIEVELDDSDTRQAVDIKKIFKCFDNIPDWPGTTYSVTLCTDIPINSNPLFANDFPWLSPGHVFVVLTKRNGADSVTQAFGLYPVSGKSSITSEAPVPSNVRDDYQHQINASIKMNNVDATTFNLIRTSTENDFSKRLYDIRHYNCANFALDIFNLTRSPADKITLPPFTAYPFPPPPQPILIDQSPQMLFVNLKLRKQSNTTDAPNIVISENSNYKSPLTKGECN